jgi:hypothetical protein
MSMRGMIIKNRLFKQMPSRRPLKLLSSTRRLADQLLSSLILSLVLRVRILKVPITYISLVTDMKGLKPIQKVKNYTSLYQE